jgi:hypothetical protein
MRSPHDSSLKRRECECYRYFASFSAKFGLRFLWASLQMRLLQSMKVPSGERIRQALSALPKDLNETYRRLFDNIDEELSERALLALKWIVLATRPLFIEELVEACAFRAGPLPALESESSRLEAYNIFELLQDLIVIEPALVIGATSDDIEPGTHVVTLAHNSLAEYLTDPTANTSGSQPFRIQLEAGHRDLARHCLSFLFHYNTHGSRVREHPLLQYAWFHWEKHIPSDTNVSSQLNASRTRGLSLYNQFLQMASGAQHVSEQVELLRVVNWLPRGQYERLTDALGTAYFHSPYSTPSDTNTEQRMDYTSMDHSSRSIRLCHLVPSLSALHIVSGSLTVVDLDDEPKFDALSWVWGPHEPSETMVLNGAHIKIRQNLHSCLRRLCAQEESQMPALWIDAICIDAANIAEKNHQVQLMGSIYAAAQRVVVWLGTEQELEDKSTLIEDSRSSMTMHQDLHSLDNKDYVASLLDNSYWDRTWITQEIVLAPQVTIFVGLFSFSLSVLEDHVNRWRTSDVPEDTFMADPRLSRLRSMIASRLDYRAGH